MKKMKQFLLLACFIACIVIVNAQSSLTIDASQLYASFKFNDSQGNKLNSEYSGVFTGAYGVGYRYVTDFGLIIKQGIGMRNAGASLVYDDMNYSWKLQYADSKLGFGYIYIMDRINPYFVASGYFAYLLRGIQIINNENFNITESGLLNKMDYGVIFTPGVEFKLSDYVSSYLEFNYLWGLNNVEMDEGQKATNFAYGLTLGLSFSITKK
ncbi:MAG: outer membrane beta-barrel protein [Bacteroidota bacterium]